MPLKKTGNVPLHVTIFGKIEKRVRLVIAVVCMSLFMLLSTFLLEWVWFFLPIHILLTYSLVVFAILEGIRRSDWFNLFIVSVLFSVVAYLFYLLFPVRWLTRLPFILFYGISQYAIILSANIFNVGVGKTIQLFRPAFSVNFFYQTLVLFLMLSVLFSFKTHFLINGFVTFVCVFMLSVQLLWSVKLKEDIDTTIFYFSTFLGLLFFQFVVILSFVPLKTTIFALLISAWYYAILGLFTHYLDNKLFKQTVREYVFVAIFAVIIALLTLRW